MGCNQRTRRDKKDSSISLFAAAHRDRVEEVKTLQHSSHTASRGIFNKIQVAPSDNVACSSLAVEEEVLSHFDAKERSVLSVENPFH